jgi:group I intron endonuclease
MPPIYNDITGVIYKTTNIINGMWYIGKDEHNDPGYLGSGVYLSRAVAKYGKNNFVKEILDYAKTPRELALLEAEYIKRYNATSDNMSYNIALGGFGGNTLAGMDDEDRAKFSAKISDSWANLTIESKHDRVSPMHNSTRHKPKSNLHKDKISKAKTGIKQSPETVEKKREISKKLYNNGIICPPKNDWTGKTHRAESKLKISESKKGIKNTKKRLFSKEEQLQMKVLYDSGVRTGIIAKTFSTSGPTVLRYIREITPTITE